MHLIVGLGNPGNKYIHTRHNAGFMYLDYLATYFHTQGSPIHWKQEDTFKAEIAMIQVEGKKIALLKPQTFMNESGKSVKLFFSYYQLTPENIILVHDDLDIPLGKYKWNMEKSPKVHNGILSIEKELKTVKFRRLRIGIDNRTGDEKKIPGMNYVLANFSAEEQKQLQQTFAHTLTEILPVI